ncbi:MULTISPECIES: RNA polymerase sigma factor [unclassified Mesorhizobium]|uniref:RNA polymerase sigma factor n=1 Tax=unclassified Mesorhizobium TaxID=325217 RepID=UPI000FCADA95|nr:MULTISPECIES: RNA polymerase sigma factor [unclassified Mesorhizobium]RUV96893.1 RNA polymerase sigma factor [Mesorhizobium sp. M1A.F.Ca.IN.020.04.1.1]RUW07492.1 RNA polymerase sigma factor [Mesorhizobium sp. M1A.F.Ca.IN.020.03.1.1]RWF70225.1 MAG: RNA polymerase sigma factor [Mesorhizobium sp.]RWG13016.1 MAG: RNA polymerase sigma factor [Mesorhizobium sp.]RWG28845.1 MAG: RNA polymerase sigma factor [Mesorhizobium sp.]
MKSASQAAAVSAAEAGEMALVRRALARDPGAFRLIIKTYNQRLYRIARGVVRNDAEAEDIVQEAYMRAFASLDSFRGDASLSTWLSRIVINEALGRLRKKKRIVAMPENPDAQIIRFPLNSNDLNPGDDPERTMAQRQILGLVERATDSLPDVYRTVFVARVIEGLSIEETADLLGIRPETVKTRLHRARALVRKALDDEIGPVLLDAFPFAGRRCERLTQAVMKRLGFEA